MSVNLADLLTQTSGDVRVTIRRDQEPLFVYEEHRARNIAAVSINFLSCDVPAVRIAFTASKNIGGFRKSDILGDIKEKFKKLQNGRSFHFKVENKRGGEYIATVTFKK